MTHLKVGDDSLADEVVSEFEMLANVCREVGKTFLEDLAAPQNVKFLCDNLARSALKADTV